MTDLPLAVAFTTIAQRVCPGATLLSHRPLGGGVSAAVHALEVSSAAGRTTLVVRRHGAAAWKQLTDDVTQTEFELLATLCAQGLPVPKPLLLDVSGDVLPSPFFVMEMVTGSTEIPTTELDSALRQMADFLARLHALDAQALRLPVLPQREDPIRGTLEFIANGDDSASLRDRIASYRVQPSPTVLLHGDFWPGNVLWLDARLCAVLDWEDAAIGPAVSDVACCRAELNALFDASASLTFTDYYRAASGSKLRNLPLWDVYVGSAALATLHAWGLPPDVEAQRREKTRAFVAKAAKTFDVDNSDV